MRSQDDSDLVQLLWGGTHCWDGVLAGEQRAKKLHRDHYD